MIREYMNHLCGQCKENSDTDSKDERKVYWEVTEELLIISGQTYTSPKADQHTHRRNSRCQYSSLTCLQMPSTKYKHQTEQHRKTVNQ